MTRTATALLLLLLATLPGVAGATDETVWKARVEKAAPAAYKLSTAPILCYCPDGVNRVGQLMQGINLEDAQTYSVNVTCVIPLVSFTTGDVDTGAVVITCANFVQLIK